jgi:hypothetical protein
MLKRGQGKHVRYMGVLVKLEPLVFLKQLGGPETPPNHPGIILAVQRQGSDGSSIVKDGLGGNQYMLPCIIRWHSGRQKNLVERLKGFYLLRSLSPGQQKLFRENRMSQRVGGERECKINCILNHPSNLL